MTDVGTEFQQATDFAIRDEDIERSRALVGIDLPKTYQEHFTQASYDVIRNFARGYGDDNPLFGDEHYGDGTRWQGQIAPPMIGVAMNKPLLGDPPDPPLRRASFKGVHVFVSGSSWDFYRPVRPGDTLRSFGGVDSVEVKESEFAGRSVLITNRVVRMNQNAEVVSVSRTLSIYAERGTARKKGKYSALEPASYSDEDIARIDEIYAAETARGSRPRYWEDVQIGDSLPPMAKGPLTMTDIIVFHAGGYGFVPYAPTSNRIAYRNRQRIPGFYVKNEQGIPDVAQRVHWDAEWARAIGSPMPYDYGVLRDCWLSHYITDWMGDDAWLVRQSSEIRKFNHFGDWHLLTGEVVGKRREAGLPLVDIEIRGTNQRGAVTCPARATVILPSHAAPAPPLPAVPQEIADRAVTMMERHRELSR